LPIIAPVQLPRITAPFDHPDWLFELKYDGFRGLVYVRDGRVEHPDGVVGLEGVEQEQGGCSLT
jgi:hypothetical protein